MTDPTRQIMRRILTEQQEDHVGDWYHGGAPGPEHHGEDLYVTDEIREAQHYASRTDGIVYRLKEPYNVLVNWLPGESEGIIEQEAAETNGGFHEMFEPLSPSSGNKTKALQPPA